MKSVVMIGPCPDAKGGMSSVIAVYRAHGLFSEGDCRYLITATEGNTWHKLWVATSAFGLFVKLLALGRVSVLHAHVASGVSFWRKSLFIGLAYLFGCPVIFQLHGAEFRTFVAQRLTGWRKNLAFKLMRESSLVFVLSRDAEELLRTNVGLSRIELFPNPIATPKCVNRARTNDVVFLGQIGNRKGAFDLIKSFSDVHKKIPSSRLILAGNGEIQKAKELVSELNLGHSVIFSGWVNEEQRTKLLSEAGVFVLPSYNEQMPMSVLEAMASEVPIIASTVAAIPDMLEHGKCGVLIPPGNIQALGEAIAELLADPKRASDLAKRAHQRVHLHYSADVVLKRLRWQYGQLAR
ncbi:glycosyltransferase family 4 protein [Dechloromonas denitrificans]|uniref:glycosyltransferase family 4 protein n=1 Tax=Dechloromonas denitrificans TaxID=281362 RepID=UPI001CFB4828|nr:glycosyltransferase family 4 protein [Dechloromonas denitrificans]UCV09831.1 glycosyltransferase family 4 protein [Dechloromonas denitrificans]